MDIHLEQSASYFGATRAGDVEQLLPVLLIIHHLFQGFLKFQTEGSVHQE